MASTATDGELSLPPRLRDADSRLLHRLHAVSIDDAAAYARAAFHHRTLVELRLFALDHARNLLQRALVVRVELQRRGC
jgi:hypothetical protein